MPREGSFALASLGRVRKVQATAFAIVTGRKSVALNRILEAVAESPSARAVQGLLARDVPLALGFAMLRVIIRSSSCVVSLGCVIEVAVQKHHFQHSTLRAASLAVV